MDFTCPPAITTAALFTAILFLDLFRADFQYMPGHAILGTVAYFLMAVLCSRGAALGAWILLGTPFLLLLFGWIVWATKWQSQAMKARAAEQVSTATSAAPYCRRCPAKTQPCCVDPDKLMSA
jgi:hypothetical protein